MLGLRGELAATYAATVSCRLSDPVKEIALFVYPIYHGVMKEQTPKAKWKPLTFMKYYSYFGTSSLILSAYKLTCDFYFYFYFFLLLEMRHFALLSYTWKTVMDQMERLPRNIIQSLLKLMHMGRIR